MPGCPFYRRSSDPFERERRLIGLNSSDSRLRDLYESAEDGNGKKRVGNLKNETDQLVRRVREKAKVTWLGALNHFRITKQAYKQDTLFQAFLDEAEQEIKQKTTSAVGGIRKWFQWTKYAEYVTLKHQLALKKCDGVLLRMQERQSEIESLLNASSVANELRGYKGPMPLASKETQALTTALSVVREQLQQRIAKNVQPTPKRFETALTTEPQLKEVLSYFKVIPPDKRDWYFKRNEDGYADLITAINSAAFLDEYGNDMPGAKLGAVNMAKLLQKAKGYSAFKLARPDVNAMQPQARFETLVKGDYLDSSIEFSVPGRPNFRAKIVGRHPDDKSALILQAPSATNPREMERVVLAMGEQGPSLLSKGRTGVEIAVLRDKNFILL